MKTDFLELMKANIGKHISEQTVGLGKWLNGRIEAVNSESGQVRLSFEVREDMLNPLGMLHGGAMAAILDECMGMQLFLSTDEGSYVAIGLHVDFLNKALPGQRVIAVPHVTRVGRSVAHATCELYNEEGKLLAKGSNNFSRIG